MRRLFIFGWDGADDVVVSEGLRRGALPTLASLIATGERTLLRSTVPPITPVAWTSFLTGENPGVHGVFGFESIDPVTYARRPEHAGARRVPTLFRRLDAAGVTTALVTVPWTFPAEPLDLGVVIPGWDAPDTGFDHIHPRGTAERLRGILPSLPLDISPSDGVARALARARESVAVREAICHDLLEHEAPKVLMTVFMETDRMSHTAWTAGPPPPALIETYALVDAAMGRVIDRWASPDDLVVVCSDHGSAPVHQQVNLAPMLERAGLLELRRSAAPSAVASREARRIWSRLPISVRSRLWRRAPRLARGAVRSSSAAIDHQRSASLPFGRLDGVGVYLNGPPTFPTGPVPVPERARVLHDLEAVLSRTEGLDGRPVFDRIDHRDAVYLGPATEDAPDLLLTMREGAAAGAALSGREPVVATTGGGHRRDGVVVANRPMELGDSPSIADLLPIILRTAGLSPSPEVDHISGSAAYEDDELELVAAHLRDLGYIE